MNRDEVTRKTTAMLDLMEAGGDLQAATKESFHHMGLADEVLGDHKEVKLSLMMTTDPLRGYSDDLYRAHVRELLARALAGEDMRPGTYAEMLGSLSNASLKSPLHSSGLFVMEHCFEMCFQGTKLTRSKLGGEAYPGELDENIREARHMLRQDWRK